MHIPLRKILHPRLLIKSTISPADHSFTDIHVTCPILYIHIYGSSEHN